MKLKKIRQELEGVKFILIDEFGLLGQKHFATIDYNLRQAAIGQNQKEPFGGWSIIMFGDFTQLPPVFDEKLYREPNWKDNSEKQKTLIKAYNLWNNEFKKAVCLSQVRRTDLTQGGREWKQVTDELFEFRLSKQSAKIINSRRWENLTNEVRSEFEDAMHGFATNREMNIHNGNKLIKMMRQDKRFIVRSQAVNSSSSAKAMTSDSFKGLVNELFVCIGCEVTLTCNLNTEAGLFNSSKGKVVDIVFSEEQTVNSEMPAFILVKFESFKGKL